MQATVVGAPYASALITARICWRVVVAGGDFVACNGP